MTRRIVIEQADYLSVQAGLETALRFYAAVDEAFTFLATHSGVGSTYEGRTLAGAGLRVWTITGFRNHLAFYRPIADGIEVVRVLHGARDIGRVLGFDEDPDGP